MPQDDVNGYNSIAIQEFGETSKDMDIDAPHGYVDQKLIRIFTYLDLYYIQSWAINGIDKNRRKEMAILDVGAGKGRITKRLASYAQKVVAVEPFEPFFRTLIRTCRMPNVECFHGTLSQYRKSKPGKFDLIFISGVITYIDDAELDQFCLDIRELSNRHGLILLRDFGIENKSSGTGVFGSIKDGLEILRPPRGTIHAFSRAGLDCLRYAHAYPSVPFWVLYRLLPNPLTKLLWDLTSRKAFYPFYKMLSTLNLPHTHGCYWIYLFKKGLPK